MPWPGNPRVNMQNEKGYAKAYQVRQLLEAAERRVTQLTVAQAQAVEVDRPRVNRKKSRKKK